jgi:hypothetical protein
VRKLLLIALCACAAPLPRPGDPGARDAWRAELSRNPKGPRARQARERLEQAEWDAARAAHTIFAYRRFAEEFSDSRHAGEGRQLLEGLRWAETERDGSERALSGYLADEPRGAHAAQAWTLLSALRLGAVLRDGSARALREWLVENPAASGRERAEAALDETDFREAADGTAWRRYLEAHPDGAHRKEAQARLEGIARADAELLEDEAGLRARGDVAAERIAYQRAAALLDEGKLAQIARRAGPFSAEAARDLAGLRKDRRRAGALESAAQKLFLPRASLRELPEAGDARARALRGWAAAADGERLHRILGELSSQRAQVALAALDAAEQLLASLPAAEARVRAEKELAALRPLAQDGPQLAGVAVLELALGHEQLALAAAREGAGRNPRCAPAVWLAARMEKEPGLVPIAAQVLRGLANALAAEHTDAAVGELCAARRAAEKAAELLPEARAEAVVIARRCGREREAEVEGWVDERRNGARELAGARTALTRSALARAAVRDPDAVVKRIAQEALASGSIRP